MATMNTEELTFDTQSSEEATQEFLESINLKLPKCVEAPSSEVTIPLSFDHNSNVELDTEFRDVCIIYTKLKEDSSDQSSLPSIESKDRTSVSWGSVSGSPPSDESNKPSTPEIAPSSSIESHSGTGDNSPPFDYKGKSLVQEGAINIGEYHAQNSDQNLHHYLQHSFNMAPGNNMGLYYGESSTHVHQNYFRGLPSNLEMEYVSNLNSGGHPYPTPLYSNVYEVPRYEPGTVYYDTPPYNAEAADLQQRRDTLGTTYFFPLDPALHGLGHSHPYVQAPQHDVSMENELRNTRHIDARYEVEHNTIDWDTPPFSQLMSAVQWEWEKAIGVPLIGRHGLPLRPWVKECQLWEKGKVCTFGAECKFHHTFPPPLSANNQEKQLSQDDKEEQASPPERTPPPSPSHDQT